MPKQQDTQFSEAPELQKVDSVFDFLYADTRRIASFLSQFTAFGHLTEIVHGEHTKEAENRRGTVKGSTGLPGLASLDGTHEIGTASEHGEAGQRRYDPTWTNALNFLNYLAELDLLNRDIQKAGIGEFVLFTGELKIHDLKMLERMWRLPSVERAMRQGSPTPPMNRQARRRAGQTSNLGDQSQAVDMLLDMLTVLPHSVQATLSNGFFNRVWCTLLADGLSTATSDLMLKHGGGIPGNWSVVGILDARPPNRFASPESLSPEPDFSDGKDLGAKILELLAPITKNMLGRPDEAFGITPLLVFRDIGRKTLGM